MRIMPTIALALFIPMLAQSAAAATDAWVGQAWEHDEFGPGNPQSQVRTSCDSTVGAATLVHHDATWRFATVNDDCVGYDSSHRDDQCTTDSDGVLFCTKTDAVATLTLTFAPNGHVTADYQSTFWGDHYHVEGDLIKV